jgi:tetratricopeptide (TPR) repeat protein
VVELCPNHCRKAGNGQRASVKIVLLVLLAGTLLVCAVQKGIWPSAVAAQRQYERIESDGDAAQADVDQWVKDYAKSKDHGTRRAYVDLQRRIALRFEPVKKEYEAYLAKCPDTASAHLAFGNFLSSRDDEEGARTQWEKALQLDPSNGDCYNNLAGLYCESGHEEKGFRFYDRAIEINPANAVFYHNFANGLCVMSKQAAAYFRTTEQEVYAKALDYYRKAATLAPKNLDYALDAGEACYAMRPIPTEEALQTWTNALEIARNEVERQQILVHIARVKMLAGNLEEARSELKAVTTQRTANSKINLLRAIKMREDANSADGTVAQ